MTTHPEVPQATAREEAIAVVSKMLPTNLNYDWAAEILDALLAAIQVNGTPLVILGPEQVGWLGPYGVIPGGMDNDPAPNWLPLFRAPFIEAQREEA